jgi:hypothetical protein
MLHFPNIPGATMSMPGKGEKPVYLPDNLAEVLG